MYFSASRPNSFTISLGGRGDDESCPADVSVLVVVVDAVESIAAANRCELFVRLVNALHDNRLENKIKYQPNMMMILLF